jgi:molybdate/tungstate transport system substrate-binding protein
MLCQLAELYYDDDTIFKGVLGSFTPPITVSENNGSYTISVPETPKPKKVMVKGSSINLLAPLRIGEIDYAFEYQSVAEQQGFKFLELPREIDLSSDEYKEQYEKVKVELDFQRFASVTPEFVGEPIIYGMTIPQNAPHPELAVEFIKFVISQSGQDIFARAHHPTLVPAEVDRLDKLPSELKPLVEETT